MTAYADVVLGEDDGDDIDVDSDPTREEVIILSSEGSDESHQDLIHRSARASLQRGTVHEPVADDVETLVENSQGDTVEQLETRKKRKRDKTEEKKDEDQRRRRLKKEVDAQAAAALAEKKSRLQKDTATTPSKLEVDLGAFSANAGNLLEKMYKSASGSRAPKSDSRGKEKEDEVEQVRNVTEDVAVGARGGEDYVEGVETNVESSEATPKQGTIYTKCVPGSGRGGASGTRKSPEFTHVQSGSWDTHNPACDDLPHAPH
ncbi:hypothetical protein Hanom_Chr13g01194751 [Helianthus anomalus]